MKIAVRKISVGSEVNTRSLDPLAAYALAIFISYIPLQFLSSFPLAAVLFSDFIICGFIVLLFPQIKLRWVLFIHPVLILITSTSFRGNWFNAGDGTYHTAIASQVLSSGIVDVSKEIFTSYNTGSWFLLFKVLSPGALPGFILPSYFFRIPFLVNQQHVFVASQALVYLVLIGLIAGITRKWRVLDDKFAFYFVAFLIISPTVLLGNSVPNRHFVTMAGIALLCLMHLVLSISISPLKIFLYSLSLLLVVMSKPPLILAYILFFATKYFVFKIKKLRTFITWLLIASAFIFIFRGSSQYYSTILSNYDEIRQTGANNTFNGGVFTLPLVGWFLKYLYALLSPFPWRKYEFFVNTTFTGSYLLFITHILSSLTGLYLFTIVIVRFKKLINLLRTDLQVQTFTLFGLVMSTSILYGATGFHGYLSMFFPTLFPMVTYKQLRVPIILPLGFSVFAEVLAAILQFNTT